MNNSSHQTERPPLHQFRGTSRSTLLIDRFMTYFVMTGGILIILIVFGIFLFIFWQITPLFGAAQVTPIRDLSLPVDPYVALGSDEWGQSPFLCSQKGTLSFFNPESGQIESQINIPSDATSEFSVIHYSPLSQSLALGTLDGKVKLVHVGYKVDFQEGIRTVTPDVTFYPSISLGSSVAPVIDIAAGESEDFKVIAAFQKEATHTSVHAVTMKKKRSLTGSGKMELDKIISLTESIHGTPTRLAVNDQGDHILVANDQGDVFFFQYAGSQITLKQAFHPFRDTGNQKISSMAFIFGGVSVSLTNAEGVHRIFSLYIPPKSNSRVFGQIKEFPPLPSSSVVFTPSQRNKSFLIGSGSLISLRHSTTETIRWEENLPFNIRLVSLGGKYDRIFALGEDGQLHIYELYDQHPESSWKALFSKIWYEGGAEPVYQWQSTGGTDDFEPKLSLVPLIFGTLKGTFFAMLFATPIALLAAIYTSDFMHWRFRILVKPTMEIMASLPSVVLGFLGALWLAPLVETRVISIFLILLLVPLAALLTGFIYSYLPVHIRLLFRSGSEFLYFLPIFIIVAFIGWELGPPLEYIICTVPTEDGQSFIRDFRYWWPQVTGATFEQRNSMVVGFMMGFAVIPIIFTIAEDSLTNVPHALRSGSMALGATRWQTALKVVLPTASPGIFSAIMIGLGRAVGETMIVVMATGNTPIMEYNIFSGMRTLSANIAVELPEAPYLGTLYRTLFLGALALFILTFSINTLAEILRHHLREKYKTVE